MITSVGDFGYDHNWWGSPEYQDNMPVTRGGAPRDARNETGANILGHFAANLAFVSKLYMQFDQTYSEKCLEAARNIYDYVKVNQISTSTSAYSGNNVLNDKTAFAAMALIYATGERKYLDDLCFDTTIGSNASSAYWAGFDGGWFANQSHVFDHEASNTCWASSHVYVLWGFFRLILENQQLCTSLELNENDRLKLIEKTAANLISNISYSTGDQTIDLPAHDFFWIEHAVKYELPWFIMHTNMEWYWNEFQAGNMTDLYCYYDIASRLQGTNLPHLPVTTDWNANEVKEVLVRQFDYMLGVNPWDISMIYGIGAKNLNHPHHRASNPELRNNYFEYNYRHLTGALAGGYIPSTTLYSESAGDYLHTDVSIGSTANLLVPVFGLSSTKSGTGISRNPANKALSQNNCSKVIISRIENGFYIKSNKPVVSAVLYKLSGQVIAKYSCFSRPVETIKVNAGKGKQLFSSGFYFVKVNFMGGGAKVMKFNAF